MRKRAKQRIVKLVIGYRPSASRLGILRRAVRGIPVRLRIVCSDNHEVLAEELRDADAYVPGWGNPIKELIPRAPRLRWVQLLSAGVDGLLTPEIVRPGLVLTKARGVHAVPMAEHAMAMLLAVTRNLHALRLNQGAGRWKREKADELFGKTLLVVGAGSIGGEVARRAKAFGMRILGVARSVRGRKDPDYERIYGLGRLGSAVRGADAVFCSLPLTARTKNVINAGIFGRMKNGAVFMNFGRGGTVEEKALIGAVRSGRLRAAILDVFLREPLDAGSALWRMKNVYISPHMSAQSPATMEREFGLIAENLGRFAAGKPLLHVVDPGTGY
jgi:phosphoglycerate dehydrogenase-like enzyme